MSKSKSALGTLVSAAYSCSDSAESAAENILKMLEDDEVVRHLFGALDEIYFSHGKDAMEIGSRKYKIEMTINDYGVRAILTDGYRDMLKEEFIKTIVSFPGKRNIVIFDVVNVFRLNHGTLLAYAVVSFMQRHISRVFDDYSSLSELEKKADLGESMEISIKSGNKREQYITMLEYLPTAWDKAINNVKK